jgi:hypothetical protein
VLAACAAALAPAAPALAAGEVAVSLGGKGTTLRIQGDPADNAIDVRISTRDVTVTGSGGTVVVNGLASAERLATLVIDMSQGGNDSVRVLPALNLPAAVLPDTELSVKMGRGDDSVEADLVGFLRIKLRLGAGNDRSTVRRITVEDSAIFDGGPGVDDARYDFLYNLPFEMRGFESLFD